MSFKLFGFIGGKNKKNKKEFSQMDKKEKKEFLSSDLIERMIRVEQRVASSFGGHIPIKKTEYYKNLRENEKKSFYKYLKRKNIKKKSILLVFFLSLVSLVFLGAEFTGKAVDNVGGTGTSRFLSVILVLFILVMLFFSLILFIFKKIKKRRFEKHFDILDNIGLRKYTENLKI